MTMTSASSLYHYLVIRYEKDAIQANSVPVGLMFWHGSEPTDLIVRMPVEGEGVAVDRKVIDSLGRNFLRRLRLSLKTGKLPFGEAEAYSEEWWLKLKTSFIHCFKVDGPRQFEASNPELDLELQYNAIVQPFVTVDHEDKRIDTWLNHALGDYREKFESRQPVPGYKGRPVHVLKSMRSAGRIIAIDAVNLTTQNAEVGLEAMLHRAAELKKYCADGSLELILGYYASPSGLNGEAMLVELGEKITGEPLIDLANSTALGVRLHQTVGT